MTLSTLVTLLRIAKPETLAQVYATLCLTGRLTPSNAWFLACAAHESRAIVWG